MLVHSIYHQFRQQLAALYPAGEASAITDLCFSKIARVQKKDFIHDAALATSPQTAGALQEALQQLLQHRPVQYVLGEAIFGHLTLLVNEEVLIPRPETEELAAWMVSELKPYHQLTIMDIGTGSGCIPIYLHSQMPQHQYHAVEVSSGALAVARKNAEVQQANINFLQANILDPSVWPGLPSVNIIVSNPPYIPQNETPRIDKHVAAYEPHLALFVPDNNPLLFYEAIVQYAVEKLVTPGYLYLETHWQYATQVGELCRNFFEAIEVREDLFGQPRMVKASRCR